MNKALIFKKTAALICDVACMPIRALVYDAKRGYNMGNSKRDSLYCSSLFVAWDFLFAFSPVFSAIIASSSVGFMPSLTVPLTIATIYATAWDHPINILERRDWERFPIARKFVYDLS